VSTTCFVSSNVAVPSAWCARKSGLYTKHDVSPIARTRIQINAPVSAAGAVAHLPRLAHLRLQAGHRRVEPRVEGALAYERLDELLADARVRGYPAPANRRILRLVASNELAHELALGGAVLAHGVWAHAGLAAAQHADARSALTAAVQVREVRHCHVTRVRTGRDADVAHCQKELNKTRRYTNCPYGNKKK
jgi:hypothetical protein